MSDERLCDFAIEAQCSKCGTHLSRPWDDAAGTIAPINATLRIQCPKRGCGEVNLATWSLRNYLKLVKEQ